MKTKYIFWKEADSQVHIKESLQNNEVVVGSSDTVFGLLANVTQQGFDGLNKTKKRFDKPYIILISRIDKLKYFIDIASIKDFYELLNFCWPGPLTVVFKAKDDLPDFLKSSDGTIALRVPQHEGMLDLLKDFEGLFSTSANLTGKPVPRKIEELSDYMIQESSFVVLDRDSDGTSNTDLPSTILDCSQEKIKVIREGAYSISSLERVYGSKILD